MKVPSRRFSLAGGLVVCEPREKTPNVVQGHIVKHPVGVTSLVGGGAWADERWDELGVIDETTRAAFVSQVLRLRDGRSECSVPELRGAPDSSALRSIACDRCPTALATACAALTAPTIGGRYLGVLDEVLEAASGPAARSVTIDTLARHLFAGLRVAASLANLVVVSTGLDARRRRSTIVRLSRGDGVRAELYYEEPDQLSWRTLHRHPKAVSSPNGLLQFLLDAPPQGASNTPVSGMCLVSRPFWEKP